MESSTPQRPVQQPVDSGRGFTVREVTPADCAMVRAHVLRVLDEDLKTGYLPHYHWDLDQMEAVYLDDPRQALFVAVDNETGALAGCIAIRTDGPKSPPHPAWLAERYAPANVAQVLRAYIVKEHRRRGVATALVEAARRFVRAAGSYDTIYLHTNPSVPGAEAFWRRMPTTEIFDSRRQEGAPNTNAVHFELAMLPSDEAS